MQARLKGIYEVILIGIGLAIIICFIYFYRNKNNARAARMACYRFFTYGGITLEQLGDFDEETDLIIMNHQSVADILCLEAYHPRNICWIAKKQLGKIPFYGYALTGPEMILIDRDDKRGLASLLKAVKQKLTQNRPIVIFPEGTRSKGRERFLPFKPGAKIIAEKFRLKVQPIVLINTRKIYNSSLIEATSDVARMVLLKPFYVYEHPSTQVFYRDENSLAQAKTGAKKAKGLQPIYDSRFRHFIAHKESPQHTSNSTEPLESWYEELQQCMQEVYTHHYHALEKK